MNDSLVSVRLPEDIVEFIDFFVRNGIVECRSEILRTAILFKLKNLGYDVNTEELEKVLARLNFFRQLLGGISR